MASCRCRPVASVLRNGGSGRERPSQGARLEAGSDHALGAGSGVRIEDRAGNQRSAPRKAQGRPTGAQRRWSPIWRHGCASSAAMKLVCPEFIFSTGVQMQRCKLRNRSKQRPLLPPSLSGACPPHPAIGTIGNWPQPSGQKCVAQSPQKPERKRGRPAKPRVLSRI
jgi:hypothetical protein